MHIKRNTAHNNEELIKLGFSAIYLLLNICSKMLSSSRDVLLKLSETTSPQKLFPSDCITLYWFQGCILLPPQIHNPPCLAISRNIFFIVYKLNLNFLVISWPYIKSYFLYMIVSILMSFLAIIGEELMKWNRCPSFASVSVKKTSQK